ncbi:MAG: formylmethanofuran dehydrogenase subunit E family protein [Candidatus Korarchaeum sp.]
MLSLEDAVRMHGHRGPWLVLGYRAGLRALELLRPEDEHELSCTIRCPVRTPYTCSVDGIQASTGCTTGKMSLRVEEHDDIEFLFLSRRKNLKLRLKLREGIRELIEEMSSREGLGSASAYVEGAELGELFEEAVMTL